MMILFLVFIFICSFVLFVTSRHDFALLRQNISIRHVFDKAVIVLLFSLIISRTVFLIDQGMYDFLLNPLRFLHVILFFGFSLLGLSIAFALGVVAFFYKKKNFMRIFDIYFLSFFPMVIFDGIYHAVSTEISILIGVGYIVSTILIFLLLIKMYTSFKIKDGVVGFIILILIGVSYLSIGFLINNKLVYSPVQLLALLAIAVPIYCITLIQVNFFKDK